MKNSEPLGFEPLKSPFRWAVLTGIWLAYYCFGLPIVTLAPLVTEITSDLDISNSEMGTILGAWQLVYIASAVPLGILLDRIGVRRAIMFAFTMIAISVVSRSNAEGFTSLFIAVAIFGLGGPLISVGAPKSISLWFDDSERGFAMGIYMTAPSLGSMTGLSLTNSLFMPMLEGDWRSVLLLYATFIFSTGLVWCLITAHKQYKVIEEQQSRRRPGSEHKNILRLLKIPAFQIVLTMAIGIFFFNHGLNNWLPTLLQEKNISLTRAGFWSAISMLSGVIGLLIIPSIARHGYRIVILAVIFIIASSTTFALIVFTDYPLYFSLIVSSIVRAPMMPILTLMLMETKGVGSIRMGAAGGLFFTAAEIGGVSGPFIIGVIRDRAGTMDLGLIVLGTFVALLILLLPILKEN